MALDKLVDSAQLNSDLGDVADAIRAKSGGSSQLAFPSGFISEIGNISTGGGLSPVVKQYTHVESWTNNTVTKGTIKNFADTYLPEYPNGVYFVVINNTNTANNAGQYLLSDGRITLYFCVYKLRGQTSFWSADTNNFYLGAGSTITTYYYGEAFPV